MKRIIKTDEIFFAFGPWSQYWCTCVYMYICYNYSYSRVISTYI